MVVPYGRGEQQLVRYERTRDGTSVKKEYVMTVLCQEMQTAMCEREDEIEAGEERLKKTQEKLQEWKDKFVENNKGKIPSREDMFNDPRAAALFQEFSRLRKRTW